MGKVNPENAKAVSTKVDPAGARPRKEAVETTAVSRPSSRASRAGSRGSIEPAPDVTASVKIQRLGDLSRKIRAAAGDPQAYQRLLQQREALIAELESTAGVQVTKHADGTIRIRTREGRVLLDSPGEGTQSAADAAPAPKPVPTESSSAADAEAAKAAARTVTSSTRAAASEAYERADAPKVSTTVERREAPVAETPPVSAPAAPDVPAAVRSTGIALVDQAASLETKIEVLNRVEAALTTSSTSLAAMQSHQGDVDAILG